VHLAKNLVIMTGSAGERLGVVQTPCEADTGGHPRMKHGNRREGGHQQRTTPSLCTKSAMAEKRSLRMQVALLIAQAAFTLSDSLSGFELVGSVCGCEISGMVAFPIRIIINTTN
jgi:hypothetical protein